MAKQIMIVDDEFDIRLMVKKVLEVRGFEVVEASGGPEALERLRKERPDLVLIDFFMPGMTGRDLAEKIREDPKLKGLKLAFLTVAEFGETGMEELSTLGILDYIQKPFNKDDLVQRVKRMVGE